MKTDSSCNADTRGGRKETNVSPHAVFAESHTNCFGFFSGLECEETDLTDVIQSQAEHQWEKYIFI